MGRRINMIQQLYNEETLKVMIPQGSSPQFIGYFSTDMYNEWVTDNSIVIPGCGCTSYSVDKDKEQITFIVNAPTFDYPIQKPYLKSVTPKFKSKLTDLYMEWHIKFNVEPIK